jgi:catechol 2,3-dioxygenase-like lactoylglutathione lyase family enzyme
MLARTRRVVVIVVPARLSVVTLGVEDLPRMRGFYGDLGWISHSEGDEFARFEVGGAVLTLYSLTSLAEEGGLPVAARGFKGFSLAVNVDSRDQVDSVIEEVRRVGGTVSAEPVDRPWGGRSAYFTDPEGNAWEVAWLPGATFDSRGALIWPE